MRGRYNASFHAGKVIRIVLCVVAMIALFSFIVMTLWNAILPGVIHVSPINFWQAAGILVLSKILFSGFGGGGGWRGKRQEWKKRMFEKWKDMTPEEQEKFKQSWKARCDWRNRAPFSPAQRGEPGAE